MLNREAVLQSPFRPTILEAAAHVTRELPDISEYFSNEPESTHGACT